MLMLLDPFFSLYTVVVVVVLSYDATIVFCLVGFVAILGSSLIGVGCEVVGQS